MFAKYANQQHLADRMKCQIDEVHIPSRAAGNAIRARKRRAFRALTAFEAATWQPRIFEEALRLAAGTFDFEGDVLYQGEDLIDDVTRVLEAYVHQVMAQPLGYTLDEAARYLGISYRKVKRYAQTMHILHGEVKGNTMLFTQAELDRFRALDVRPGPKPVKEPML